MTLITGIIADSAGVPANGLIEFAQVVRFDTGAILVTGAVAVAQVSEGQLRSLDGSAFSLPANADITGVRVLERLGGRTYQWWTQIPAVSEIEYRLLPNVDPGTLQPAGYWWDLTGGIDFPPEAASGDYGWDPTTDDVWRNA